MKRLIAALAVLPMSPAAPASAAPYVLTPGQTCDGWPRLPIEMAPGMCAGLVVGPPPGTSGLARRTLRLPRTLVQLSGGRDWVVTDLGGWDPGKGSVWRLRAERGKPAELKRLLSGLTMPHGLGIGPDGQVYVGEMSRIIRFNPGAPLPATTVEVVVTGLPDNRLHDNRHPLSNFIFDGNGDLLVNVGAPSDQCVLRGKPDGSPRCAQTEGAGRLAGVRRYRYLGKGKWSPAFTMLARGLRNSLALGRTPSGAILQAENSYDFASLDSPFEELNILNDGGHHGWPYCFDMARPAPAWRGRTDFSCGDGGHTPPTLLLPPHAAPLGMALYDGAMFPQLKGHLLISFHGYRPTGARIVAFELGKDGKPKPTPGARYPAYGPGGGIVWKPYPGPGAEPLILTPGWNAVAGRRPMGAPVGLTVAADGALWVADDRNGTVFRIAVDRP